MCTFDEKIKDMDTEKVINDWCELINQDAEKRRKIGELYSEYMLLKDSSMSAPTLKQEENGEYTISLVLDYWNKDEIQKLKNYINKYGKTTKAT